MSDRKEQVVPEDVRNAADEIYFARCDEVGRLAPEFEESEVIDLISRAILAERERCAVIAESRYTEENTIKSKAGKTFRSGQVAIYAAQKIAAAIRRPTPPKGGEE